MLIRIGLLGAAMGMIPFLVGMLYTGKQKEGEESVLKNWCSGFVACFALFQILAIPCTFLKRSLSLLAALYLLALLALSVASLIINRRRIADMVRSFPAAARGASFAAVFALLVILFQMFVYARYTHVDDDDAFYVATAQTAVQTDSIFRVNPYTGGKYKSFPSRYVLSPFPIFIAVLSKFSGVHAAMLAHTVLPLVLLPLAYAVLFITGRELFAGDRKKTDFFVLFAAVIQMYCFSTTHTQGTVMLLRIWQGKAVLASVLLPFAFYMGLRLTQEKWQPRDWVLTVHLMLACCMVSSMGIMLGAIMLGIFGITLALCRRQLKKPCGLLLCCIPNLLFAAIYLLGF